MKNFWLDKKEQKPRTIGEADCTFPLYPKEVRKTLAIVGRLLRKDKEQKEKAVARIVSEFWEEITERTWDTENNKRNDICVCGIKDGFLIFKSLNEMTRADDGQMETLSADIDAYARKTVSDNWGIYKNQIFSKEATQ